MWHILKTPPPARRAVRTVLEALLVVGTLALVQPCAYADPVDDLRQVLPLRLEELGNPTPAILDYRRKVLQEKVEKLRTIGDLRRALALEEWKENPNQVTNKNLREIDADMRLQVGTRLTKAIRDVIKNGDANSRLAVANSIAEIGPTIRGVVEGERSGFARTLTPEVIQLTRDKDLGVRQEALRALGNIFPRPQDAVPVFVTALERDILGPKRLAADGLGQLIRVVNHLQKRGRSSTGVEAFREDVLDAVVAALKGNSIALQDADAVVRAVALQNVQVAAEALADLIPDGFAAKEFPPEDRKLTNEERKYILEINEVVARELKDFLPVLSGLKAQGPELARSLVDPESRVRLAAVDALENIGNARIRLRKRVLSVPVVKPVEKGASDNRVILAANDTLEAFIRGHLGSITKLLSDPSVELRRKAVEFLDIIEEAAVPALPVLAVSLGDPDRFVRWSAARAIANIAPAQAAVTVPGLARLLCDPDLSVRLAASKTLLEIGPAAQAAVPALASAVVNGDVEARLAAMEALQSIGPDQGKFAVPNLIEALANSDARVRRLAAKTLGSFGPAAYPAIPALRRGLGDEDQDVRINASDAILDILQRREKY